MFTPLLLLLFTVACRHCIVLASALPQGDVAFDIIVYGATPAGVLAADAAAGENASLSVLLMDPRWLVGGAMSGTPRFALGSVSHGLLCCPKKYCPLLHVQCDSNVWKCVIFVGGLAATDLGTTTAVIGGRTRKFFCFVAAAYNTSVSPYDCSSPKWDFEPHVAEAIFSNTFLASKPNLKVGRGVFLAKLFSFILIACFLAQIYSKCTTCAPARRC